MSERVDGHEWFFVAHVESSEIVDVSETDEGASNTYLRQSLWHKLFEMSSLPG